VTRSLRAILLGAAAVLVVVAFAAVGASLLIRAHNAPPQLALSSTGPSGSASALAGRWTVGPGSQVGYRAREKFINEPAETEAVARTSKITGSLVVSVQGGAVKVSQMKFTVDLASLTSQDRYASYQVYQRDFFVRSVYLQTDSFPTATFTAGSVSVPLPASGPVSLDVTGKLTVHGNTKDVTAHVQAQAGAGQAEVAGSLSVDMRDFAIDPPDISFTRAEPMVTIEYDLKMVHA
jgi:polyisoprenoid-binding protein YceI